MDVASLVLGIVSMVMGFIPCCNYLTFITAPIGLGLGIAGLVQKNKAGEADKGKAIAGIILSVIAIIIPIVVIILAGGLTVMSELAGSL